MKDSQSILDSLRRLVQELRTSSAATQQLGGISGAQAFVLQKLGEAPAMSVNELARRTLTHQSSVSVIVTKLVREGLVRRTPAPGDRRRMELTLTLAGRRLLSALPNTPQEKMLAAMDLMSAAERASLAKLLRKLISLPSLSAAPPMFFLEETRSAKKRPS